MSRAGPDRSSPASCLSVRPMSSRCSPLWSASALQPAKPSMAFPVVTNMTRASLLLVLSPIMKKHPAVKKPVCSQAEQKPADRTQNILFFFLTRQSSCNIFGVFSCLSHSYRHQQTLDKAMHDSHLSPIWGFNFSC